jgi:hypothetical protein
MAFQWNATWWSSTILVFRNDAGTTFTFPLDADINNEAVEGGVRWTPDDTQVTVASRSDSTGAIGMYAIPVTFDANGNPSVGPAVLKLTTPSFLNTGDTVFGQPYKMSVVGNFDWNPAGTALVFTPYGSTSSGEPYSTGLYTLDANQNVVEVYTGGLSNLDNYNAFGWGSNNKICYALPGSLRSVNPDGTGTTTILSVDTSNTLLYCAVWSPDASKIAFWWRDQNLKKKGAYNGMETITVSSGATTKLTSAKIRPTEWR